MKFLFAFIALLCALSASAADESTFATEAVAFLDTELPQMDKAVADKDRAYFGPALDRVQLFFSGWSGDQLERYPACSRAISDFLIVGLCKISPPGTLCEPVTFFPKVDNHIEQCRDSAKPANLIVPA
ncbi:MULTISPECIES: hypothetical protein [unclassified Duganella]|uniref:hypothetical protein n=1 Tax=unclassified Duganella TaxID=2636909 RepID=UPI000E353571|nr:MULTISPECIES: hypothetical protein [unclassified Duganella]RFP10162.1 hypothetical protein D0T23_24550 [Duganella sp. BJB475]RFP25532.1 hypothetical protein D0T21_26060 [Duganella sp. BJB476]